MLIHLFMSALVCMGLRSTSVHSFHFKADQLLLNPHDLQRDDSPFVKDAGDAGNHHPHPHHQEEVQHHNHHKKQHQTLPNFISTQYLVNGLREELRVSYQGVMALESLMPTVEEAGLFIRQVSNGRRMVQLIYVDSDTMVDCNVLKDELDLAKFMTSFLGESWKGESLTDMAQVIGYFKTFHGKNSTLEFLGDGQQLDEKYRDLVDIDGLTDRCRQQHREIREEMKLKERPGHYHQPRYIEHEDIVNDQGEDGETVEGEEEEEDDWEEDIEKEDLISNDVFGDGTSPQQQQEQGQDQQHHRAKRFIYPGTNWCGKGDRSTRYNDLGENRRTDRCCRAHDHCPHYIEGFTTKYNRFNFGLHTMSHCKCDKRFLKCLKSVETSTADMVGNIFFNIMGKNCFVLRKEKVCTKRSWWGKCVKYKKRKTAEVRDPVTF